MKAYRNWFIGVVLVSVIIMFPLGMAQAQDLSLWLDKWFKVTFTKTALHYSGPGVKPAPNAFGTSSGPGYIHVIGVDLSPRLTLIAYAKDPDTGNWSGIPLATFTLDYFAGDELNFTSSGQINNGFLSSHLGVQITGVRNKKTGLLQSGAFKTMGGYVLEVDDAQGSTELWAGSLKINGTWVAQSKVPGELIQSIPTLPH
jgi:hypothetical protein